MLPAEKPFFFTEKCFVASPPRKSAPMEVGVTANFLNVWVPLLLASNVSSCCAPISEPSRATYSLIRGLGHVPSVTALVVHSKCRLVVAIPSDTKLLRRKYNSLRVIFRNFEAILCPQDLGRTLKSTWIRGVPKSEFFERAFAPLSSHPFSLISPSSFPFGPCSVSRHFSPLHLPLYPPFLTPGKLRFRYPSDLGTL